MRLVLALVLTAVPAYANEIPLLQVTRGYVEAANRWHGDYNYSFIGENFRLGGVAHTFPWGYPTTTGVSEGDFQNPTFVLNGETLFSTWDQVRYGSFTLTQARPFVIPDVTGLPIGEFRTDTTTFTMAGRFEFGGGYDFIGQGIAEYRLCPQCLNENVTMTWTFQDPVSVPEPSSVVLLGVGLVVFATARVFRIRTQR